jgi:hypothetical protein
MSWESKSTSLGKVDYLLAALIGIGGLAVYVRTLAPDVLYSDSAEFQTLAYTLGYTHSTGYPVYLLLARLVGFLPVGTLAWRVNLLSALLGAGTLSGVYLMARFLTRNPIAAVIGSLALGVSYTFWSQAVIAEVYTAATLTGVTAVALTWRWRVDPAQRQLSLAMACLLTCLGIHSTTVLLAPVIAAFIFWTLWSCRAPFKTWSRNIAFALGGALSGLGIMVLAFWVVDTINPSTSFMQVTLIPSRSLWGIGAGELDSFFERMMATLWSIQWRGALFGGGPDHAAAAISAYLGWLSTHDFSIWLLLFATLGLVVTLRTQPGLGVFILVAQFVLLTFIANYNTSDIQVFYLATYIYLAACMAAGAGYTLEFLSTALTKQNRLVRAASYALVSALFLALVLFPSWSSRWEALKIGAVTFVKEDYAYPIYDLSEPRRVAETRLALLPDDAVLLLEWRTLYTTFYVAQVEQGRSGITIWEASPYPSDWSLPDSLVQEVDAALRNGRPVFIDNEYRNVRSHYQVRPVQGMDLMRLSP